MRKPLNLPIEKIQSLLDEGRRQSDVAMLFGVAQSTISRIACMGKTDPPEPAYPPDVRLCTCCGVMPVAEGNRFLCTTCFTHANQVDTTFSDYAMAI
ncbi:helix-turn-helix domain-containing protein [Desulfoluna spongiiphila]|uniref:hypothetical protein n=1 Tax=Desulfoluna spongiiphila TaxID=419481 RepID=UPI0012587EE5|nr:hypothetical protein [Desulfoluna spongiiphila]VVS92212.1 hypothetical protein DBB_17800 [Desulfoluna spongiiphila]